MKRLEHLSAIASGNNTKTYFLPNDNGIFPKAKLVGDLFNESQLPNIKEMPGSPFPMK